MPPCFEAAEVEAEVPRLHDLLLLPTFRLLPQTRAAEKCFDAGDELAQRKRLAKVIVGAELEADHPIELVVLRRKNQDREMLAPRAEPAAKLQSVQARHHHIENGQ